MTRRQKAIGFFITLCVLLVAAAILISIYWIVITQEQLVPLLIGILLFALIIAGIIVYTVFLVMEIKRNEEHDTFINSVTHELKTPLASIRLYLDTLKARPVPDAQRQEFYDVMLADVERLHHTVDMVLKAGVAREKRRGGFRAPLDIGELARECVDLAATRHHLQPGAIALEAHDGASLMVRGDAEELRTVVTNLLDNAVKYSGSDVRVTVSVAAPSPDTIWVRVQDRGVGIPRKQLKRIFNRFYRVQARGIRQVKGTGLGLYIVRAIARAHGGRVFAQSEGEGHGATFTVELPPLHILARRSPKDGGGMSRVLVVDDEQHIAEGVRFNLEADGHEVVVAETGEQALALLLAEDAPFDVVVLDVMLPGKNGFAVATELRAAGQFIPILMLTARGRPEDVLRGFESGADDYLPKPFELGILLARVGGLLRRRRWNERDAPVATDPPNDTYSFAGRTLDFSAMEIRTRGKTHRLTQMESELLRYLVSHPGQVISRGTLLEDVWGLDEGTDTRAIDNFVVRLRRYLEDRPGSPQFLLTVRGVGYKFQPDAARPT